MTVLQTDQITERTTLQKACAAAAEEIQTYFQSDAVTSDFIASIIYTHIRAAREL